MDEVLELARTVPDAATGWARLIAYLEAKGQESLPNLARVDLVADADRLRAQIVQLLDVEPPTENVDALYFGLFDAEDAAGGERIGFYISGVGDFDPDDPDSLNDQLWWPEGRYLESAGLDAIKAAEIAAEQSPDAQELLGYGGLLGCALLLARFGLGSLAPGLQRIVGFDSGDYAVLS